MKNIMFYFGVPIIALSLTSCLENLSITQPDFPIISSVELLIQIENNGDPFNSLDAPFIIEAEEVFNNINSYLLFDIRSEELFASGHIEGSIINIQHSNLLDYFETNYTITNPKIVLISETGQAAAYYTCLLRLYGIDNVFCLYYGMASWNTAFAQAWYDGLDKYNNLGIFVNTTFPKPIGGNYPGIVLPDSIESIAELKQERIIDLMNSDFYETIHHNTTHTNSILFKDVIGMIHSNPDGYFLVCYGDLGLYYYFKSSNVLLNGHPQDAVLYNAITPIPEFRSTGYLHTLPSNKTIVIYSYNGFYSATATAYLKLLGYAVISVLFGMNNIDYNRMTDPDSHSYDWLNKWAFTSEVIKDYPFVTNM